MKRLESINQIVHEELSKIIDREIEFPERTLVTITRVETSEDKHHAKVFFSLFGRAVEEDILKIFSERVPRLQQLLNRRLRVRPIPKIRFLVDVHEKRREKIEKILGSSDTDKI